VTHPELAELRVAIDAVDHELLELLRRRIALVLRVGDFKRERSLPVYDPERERLLLERLSAEARPPLDDVTVRRVFERIIDEARRLEQRHVTVTR
jgi:chorismate mutase